GAAPARPHSSTRAVSKQNRGEKVRTMTGPAGGEKGSLAGIRQVRRGSSDSGDGRGEQASQSGQAAEELAEDRGETVRVEQPAEVDLRSGPAGVRVIVGQGLDDSVVEDAEVLPDHQVLAPDAGIADVGADGQATADGGVASRGVSQGRRDVHGEELF